MRTRESEEMYLETILRLRKTKNSVHSVDIVEELDYAKSSVSRGVNLLAQRGYITMSENGELRLTSDGEKKAQSVYERHLVLTEALTLLGVDRKSAEDNACRIEHVITPDAFEQVKKHLEVFRKGK